MMYRVEFLPGYYPALSMWSAMRNFEIDCAAAGLPTDGRETPSRLGRFLNTVDLVHGGIFPVIV